MLGVGGWPGGGPTVGAGGWGERHVASHRVIIRRKLRKEGWTEGGWSRSTSFSFFFCSLPCASLGGDGGRAWRKEGRQQVKEGEGDHKGGRGRLAMEGRYRWCVRPRTGAKSTSEFR